VLSQVKLIAEPWDLGEGGYQLGNFPPGWAEWNDRYRDAVRSFWRGDAGTVGELASRLSGSSDIFQRAGRNPTASVNFVTSHDGFTLHDLVSYERKHNEANLEGNRDGSDNNRSANFGVEGPTQDPAVLKARARQERNFIATLLFSAGVPMLLAGDELGRTQAGNNNAYCQDNELSWLDWEQADRGLMEFMRTLIAMRKRHPAFRRRTYPKAEDVTWLTAQSAPMAQADWERAATRALGLLLLGRRLAERDERGAPIEDDDLLLLVNAGDEAIEFRLPGGNWHLLLDTATPGAGVADPYPLQARSLALLAKARS
jgi:glycogen operon protein